MAQVEKDPRPLFRQWDAEHVWHPFTQMQEYLASEPLVVVSAEGNYLIDDRGRRLFDGTSALWCNLFGHRVPEIDAAITEMSHHTDRLRGKRRVFDDLVSCLRYPDRIVEMARLHEERFQSQDAPNGLPTPEASKRERERRQRERAQEE